LFENKDLWAILPLGSTEFHGPVGPYSTDTNVAEAIARYVAEQIDSVLLPSIPYGYSPFHVNYPGTMHLSETTLISAINDIFKSVRRQGLRRFLIVTGHWGNESAMREFKDQACQDNDDVQIEVIVVFKDHFRPEDCAGLFAVDDSGGHGGMEEVSVALSEKPYLGVPEAETIIRDYPLNCRDYAKNGWSGRPELASGELGVEIVKSVGKRIVAHLKGMSEIP